MPQLSNDLDAKLYQLLNAVLHKLAADPAFAAGEAGRFWLNTASHVVKVNNGSTIVTLRDTGTPLVNGDISATAAIALSKLAVDPLARANHTGTQLASTISNFDTQVRTSRLDQMAMPTGLLQIAAAGLGFAGTTDKFFRPSAGQLATDSDLVVGYDAPNSGTWIFQSGRVAHVVAAQTDQALTAEVFGETVERFIVNGLGALSWGSGLAPADITLQRTAPGNMNLNATLEVNDPTLATHAATKNYVDNAIQGLDAKASVKAATTAALPNAPIEGGGSHIITGSTNGALTVDGVPLAAGDRVLVKNEANPQFNGIYTVTTAGSSTSAWSMKRATDADTWNELVSAFVWVEQGTTNGDSGWIATVDAGGVLETTAVTWTQFSGAGQITAGNGLTKTGNTLDVNPDNSTVEVVSDQVRVKDGGITGAKLAANAVDLAGAKVTGTLPVAHGGTGGVDGPSALFALGAVGHYGAHFTGVLGGGSISIPAATHGMGKGYGKIIQVFDYATGNEVLADTHIDNTTGDVTITVGANTTQDLWVSIFGDLWAGAPR